MISGYLSRELKLDVLPDSLTLNLKKKQDLRYGENPHQKAALYVDAGRNSGSVAFAPQLHGKELSYINLLDADAALACVRDFGPAAVCIVKHATPCACAIACHMPEAITNAFQGDPVAAFGGIVALNRPVDRSAAELIASFDKLLEVIVAPSFDEPALESLRSRWKNVRLLECGPIEKVDSQDLDLRRIVDGYLVQSRDPTGDNESEWSVVSNRQPTRSESANLLFSWLTCKHVKSNAIVLAKDQATVGIGGGQVDRVGAAKIAIEKAGERARGAVAASDAFFPFPDGPKLLLDAGVTAIIQPGGSVRDQETIDLVNKAGAAMIFTGQRHFRH
jgi:phosphoribosylaminoimidazolecarboxamide formyltransferase/IMP cyclohydrolase